LKITKLLILFVMLFLGGYLIQRSYNCVMLKMIGLPKVVTNAIQQQGIKEVAFLYDKSICTVCPSGTAIDAFNSEKTLFIVSNDFNEYDVENFVLAFQIRGPISNGDKEVDAYLERVFRCAKTANLKNNLGIKLDSKGKIIEQVIF